MSTANNKIKLLQHIMINVVKCMNYLFGGLFSFNVFRLKLTAGNGNCGNEDVRWGSKCIICVHSSFQIRCL